jgi:hypothetical protein
MHRPALAAILVAILVAGCGSASDSTPVACLEGPSFYLHKGRDGVLISECLPPNQKAGELATVGLAMLRATTKLNAQARAQPGGAANLQLGYLLGAAERGAEETEGIHEELIRRLTAAARYSPDTHPLPQSFYKAYRSGYSAGHKNG